MLLYSLPVSKSIVADTNDPIGMLLALITIYND